MTLALRPPAVSVSFKEPNWLDRVIELLDETGYAVIDDAVDLAYCQELGDRLTAIRPIVATDVQQYGRRNDGGFFSFVPLIMAYDPAFYQVLELPPILQLARRYLTEQVIVRNMIGHVVDPIEQQSDDPPMYLDYHRNFRYFYARRLTLEVAMPLINVTEKNGLFFVISGSHKMATPQREYLIEHEEPVLIMPGSLLVMDGMLWHRGENNREGLPLMDVGIQFSKPIVKQYFDFVRVLAGPEFNAQSQTVKVLLGSSSAIPASLQEFCEKQ